MIKIIWFRHAHENRNDWLRFGFMELNAKKKIKYLEQNLVDMLNYDFDPAILRCQDLRHKSFILLQDNNIRKKCLVDSEDSFVLFSELIIYADIYFCSGYNSDVFIHKKMPQFYSWQTENDLQWYKQTLADKIKKYGSHFFKVRKFIPIAPTLFKKTPINGIRRLYINFHDKIRKALSLSTNYADTHHMYLKRYQELLLLREHHLSYDITLNDTSWGWPKHRIKLHEVFRNLHVKGFRINSILKYGEPSICDNSNLIEIDSKIFPMKIGEVINYEEMLSSSKLGVFACGFHWGWRNILSLALFIGIPVVTDRLLTESYFNMDVFKIWEVEDQKWLIVEQLLNEINAEDWDSIKKSNQKNYDKYLNPETVANYFIKESIA